MIVMEREEVIKAGDGGAMKKRGVNVAEKGSDRQDEEDMDLRRDGREGAEGGFFDIVRYCKD
jgi:hypothetical protein